jgi:hypothetical protein
MLFRSRGLFCRRSGRGRGRRLSRLRLCGLRFGRRLLRPIRLRLLLLWLLRRWILRPRETGNRQSEYAGRRQRHCPSGD